MRASVRWRYRTRRPPAMSWASAGLACAAFLWGLSGGPAAASGADAGGAGPAVFTDLAGAARASGAQGTRAVNELDTWSAGEVLTLGAAARAEVVVVAAQRVYALQGPGRFVLRDGAVWRLSRSGSVGLRDLVGDWAALRLQPGPVARASVSLRGVQAGTPALRAPLDAQRAAGDLVLRWDAPLGQARGAWSYRVRLVDPDGAVLLDRETAQTVVAASGLAQRLAPGQYIWTVAARDTRGRRQCAAAAQFRVIEAGEQERLDALQRTLAQAHAAMPAVPVLAEDVLLAAALDQLGLREEAQGRWRALAARRDSLARWAEALPAPAARSSPAAAPPLAAAAMESAP